MSRPDLIAVIDFETTGMSPSMGSRATEIAAVLIERGQVVGHYQNLMRTGVWVPPFITQLTGITNAMLAQAPPAEQVMREVAEFTRGVPLVAHNAAFDRGFWRAEIAQAGLAEDPAHQFACTLLLSRRLYPEAPDHKLGTLARWHQLPRDGRAHRAMSDAELTARMLIRMQNDVQERYAAELGGRTVDHGLLSMLQRAAKPQLARNIARHCAQRGAVAVA
ncbi:PolC-type DNA polymerase III [Ideonella sp.]|uniref:3'-5' exonuclease n=1 Tax=Ideonella sp. TaxID=1929293 RepID=UPI003BB60228